MNNTYIDPENSFLSFKQLVLFSIFWKKNVYHVNMYVQK